MLKLLFFFFFYLKEILVGSALVARDSLIPSERIDPALLELDTSGLTVGQRYAIACLITMTPGTMSVGEKNNGKIILVHCLYGQDLEGTRKHLNKHYITFVKLLPF